jgi:hypothetical protein
MNKKTSRVRVLMMPYQDDEVFHAAWCHAAIDGNSGPLRAIGGVWRATPDEDEHYIYAVVLR